MTYHPPSVRRIGGPGSYTLSCFTLPVTNSSDQGGPLQEKRYSTVLTPPRDPVTWQSYSAPRGKLPSGRRTESDCREVWTVTPGAAPGPPAGSGRRRDRQWRWGWSRRHASPPPDAACERRGLFYLRGGGMAVARFSAAPGPARDGVTGDSVGQRGICSVKVEYRCLFLFFCLSLLRQFEVFWPGIGCWFEQQWRCRGWSWRDASPPPEAASPAGSVGHDMDCLLYTSDAADDM
eukprot:746613-Hanusia_phi.AAC.3